MIPPPLKRTSRSAFILVTIIHVELKSIPIGYLNITQENFRTKRIPFPQKLKTVEGEDIVNAYEKYLETFNSYKV